MPSPEHQGGLVTPHLFDMHSFGLACHEFLSQFLLYHSITRYRKVQAYMGDSDHPNTPYWYSSIRGTGEAKESPGCSFFLIPQIPKGNSLTFLPSSLLTSPSAHSGWGWNTDPLCSFIASSSILFPYPNLERFSSLELWWFIFPFKSFYIWIKTLF